MVIICADSETDEAVATMQPGWQARKYNSLAWRSLSNTDWRSPAQPSSQEGGGSTCRRCCSIWSAKGTIWAHPRPPSDAISRPFSHTAAPPVVATPFPIAQAACATTACRASWQPSMTCVAIMKTLVELPRTQQGGCSV